MRTKIHEFDPISSIRVAPSVHYGVPSWQIYGLKSLILIPESGLCQVMMSHELACNIKNGVRSRDINTWPVCMWNGSWQHTGQFSSHAGSSLQFSVPVWKYLSTSPTFIITSRQAVMNNKNLKFENVLIILIWIVYRCR